VPLSAERWKLLEPLIDAAADLPRERWSALLADACGGDVTLRGEAEHLLRHYDRADTLLDHPAVERFGSLLGEVAAPPPELVNGNYRIERKVGQGGMAAVYLAHDLRHGRKVAVKLLHPELSAAFRAERFLAEIRTMAQLHHPHILPLFDSGTADGVLFYVMPYIEGETLRQRIEREIRLEMEDVVRITREVASALDCAHRHGVVHRDIKPENILLDDGGALVADFGIALAVSTASSPEPNQAGWIAGTPRYMSPEQMSVTGAIDGRSDVYSLGAMAYEMLAGRPPFMRGRGSVPPESLRGFRGDIPAEIDAVVGRSLALLPGDRYRSAGELAVALQRSLTARDMPARGRPARRLGLALAIGSVVAAGVFSAARGRPSGAASPVAAGSTGAVPVGPHQTRNLGAYDLYLRGRDQALSRSAEGRSRAIEYFKQAIAADSSYAAAHAELAHMYALTGWNLPDLTKLEAISLAHTTALKAVALDSMLPDAWAELGFVRLHNLWDMRGAKAALDRALALDPSSARAHGYLSHLYGGTERPAESLAEARRANELDPLSVLTSIDLVSALYRNGRYDEALAQLDQLRDVDPPLARTLMYAGAIYLSKGMFREAVRAFQEWDATNAWTGRALALAGRRAEAKRFLAEALVRAEGGGEAFDVAILYEGLGDYDQAFTWLEKSFDDHSFSGYVMWPTFDRLRADPRFDRIRRRFYGGGASSTGKG
jgi:tetratricopeptide (TPR) repeat protein/tRNA A-37 threonylcarbamoyl transferase component Bud32